MQPDLAEDRGGETPLAHSCEVFDRIQSEMPEFIVELDKRGLAMRQVYRAAGNEGKVGYSARCRLSFLLM